MIISELGCYLQKEKSGQVWPVGGNLSVPDGAFEDGTHVLPFVFLAPGSVLRNIS